MEKQAAKQLAIMIKVKFMKVKDGPRSTLDGGERSSGTAGPEPRLKGCLWDSRES